MNKLILVILLSAAGCTPQWDMDIEALGVVCTKKMCATAWAATDDGAVITAAHLFSLSGDYPAAGDNRSVTTQWMSDWSGEEVDEVSNQRVVVLYVDYDLDIAVLRVPKHPDTHYPICKQTRLFMHITVVAAAQEGGYSAAPHVDFDTASGYITALSHGKFLARLEGEHGYSGAPAISDGCVAGALTHSDYGWSKGPRAEKLLIALEAALYGSYPGGPSGGVVIEQL